MDIEIKSKTASAVINTFGAQMISFKDNDGLEYVWYGDAKYWTGRAPILFPMVGGLRNDKATIGGKEFTMAKHGVVRKREWKVVSQSENTVTMSFTATEETKESYPYNFKISATYTIIGNSLKAEFNITNNDKKIMPFVLGGHPAFNCPLLNGEKFEDYKVVFEKKETINTPTISKEGLIDVDNTVNIITNEDTINLKREYFAIDAIICYNTNSHKVKLVSKKSGKGVELEYDQFDHLGIWSASNNAPFVCLEPWLGSGTTTRENDIFEEKNGMTMLPQDESKSYEYTLTIF